MKVVANHALCSGHARCAAVGGDFFELNDTGYTAIDSKAVPPGLEDQVRRGVRACPERALTLVEDDK